VLACCLAALGSAAAAAAQAPAPDMAQSGPSLRVTAADLRQIGGELQLRVSFSRPIPLTALDPSKGRFICLVLDRSVVTRRRVCLSSVAGTLVARMTAIDADGRPRGRAVTLSRTRIAASGPLLALQVPASSLRVVLGTPVAWQTLVTWKDGGACERAPGPQACTQLVPPSGALQLPTNERPPPQFVRDGHLHLLATGDAMIDAVDRVLKQRLERRRETSVLSDAHVATGLSQPFTLDWVQRARDQAQSLQPDVTAMFIGANDDFPIVTPEGGTAACCAARWIDEYGRRVESMMRSYLREGRSLVYWMTLPTPRRPDLARIYRGLNAAIKAAAARVGEGASVIDLVPVFTPDDRFQQYVTFRGRTVSARRSDGIRLSAAGAAIVATLLIDRLRDVHALQPLR
jgi:lysophospholipase L1-like esterase